MPARTGLRGRVAAVATCLVIAACAGNVATPASESTPDPTALAPEPTSDDFDRILAFAAGTTDPSDSDLGALWEQVFAELQIDDQKPYAPPARIVSYRAGELPDTACAPSGTASLWMENALYCPADGVIAYDEDWLRSMSDEFTYFAPVTVLAHEWGHHVQSLAGLPELDIARELQADCLSGLYATASGLLPHDDDRSTELLAMEQALRTWFALGDERYADSEWFDPGVHGSPQQRIMAFSTGVLSNVDYPDPTPSMSGGVPWCHGYRDFRAKDYTEIGPYRLLNPPGRPGAWAGDVYTIPAETRTTRETSSIVLGWLADLPLEGGATEAQLRKLWEVAYPTLTPIAPVPIETSVTSGTGVAWYYENRTTLGDGSEHVDSGIFGLLSPEDARGGLLVIVYRDQPAAQDAETPENIDVLEDEIATFYQVTGRLCSPDESADMSAEYPDVVCMTGLQ